MKKLLILAACLMTAAQLGAQNIAEPDFTGEVLGLRADGSATLLEKHTVQLQTKAGATAYIFGIGKVKTRIVIDGSHSSTRYTPDEAIQFIVKAVDNTTDPLSIIDIFRMKPSKKDRRAEISATGTFSGASSNNLDRLQFKAKKYGESSYLLTLATKAAGEFGITVRNPNNVDEKALIVSTFAIGDPEESDDSGEEEAPAKEKKGKKEKNKREKNNE